MPEIRSIYPCSSSESSSDKSSSVVCAIDLPLSLFVRCVESTLLFVDERVETIFGLPV